MVLSNAEKQRRFRMKRDAEFERLRRRMLFTVFSIYDSAISTWLPPMYARNKGEMLRNFADAVQDSKSNLAKHPGDYALFELGTFDDDKCIFSLLKAPIRLCLALDFIRPTEAVVSKTLKEDKTADFSGSPTK